MKNYYLIAGIAGLFLALYGIVSAFLYSNVTWFSYLVIGGTIFLGYLNCKSKNESILKKSLSKILKIYFLYIIFTVAIEIVGNLWLNLWDYPSFNLTDSAIHVLIIGYPFIFFFIEELFVLMRKKLRSLSLTIILVTLLSAFISEIPNTFAYEWVYRIPYGFEILQINILVIAGWLVLVAVPLLTKRILKTRL